MATHDSNDANILFAFYQVLNRVDDRLTPETCESLLEAIDKRPDSLEKLYLFQAVAILTHQTAEYLFRELGHFGAYLARYWAQEVQLRGEGVWRRLYGNPEITDGPRLPPVEEYPVWTLGCLFDDTELMGLLGLEAGRTPDLKQINTNLDLISTDEGMNL